MSKQVVVELQSETKNPLSIEGLRLRAFSSTLEIKQELSLPHDLFRSFLASYISDGLTVYARINIPASLPSPSGHPVLVFAHGYSPDPLEPNYFQREYYETWTNAYTKAGYLTIMPGYRGHGHLDGIPAGGYETFEVYAPLYLATIFYAIDVLNLLAGIQSLNHADWQSFGFPEMHTPLVDESRAVLSAHSMGGDVALKVLTASSYFKAASIWAGVSLSIEEISDFYAGYTLPKDTTETAIQKAKTDKYTAIQETAKAPPFNLGDINATKGIFFLENITTPLLIHHGTQDLAVPAAWSVDLHQKMKRLNKISSLFLYDNNNHELSLNNEYLTALARDVDFFNTIIYKG